MCGIYSVMAFSCSTPAWDRAIWNNPPGGGGGTIHQTYHSSIMNVGIGYNIYLPPQYAANPTQKFPVLYWFHGKDGDENTDPSTLAPILEGKIRAGTVAPMIMVFANGGRNSKYMDAQPGTPAYGSYMVESTIVKELIPAIDANFRTIGTPQARATQGMSMGGEGCLRFAFRYRQLFSSAYCFAPAIDDVASNVMSGDPALLANMFNNDASLFQQDTVWDISTNNAANVVGLPIHVTIGSADALLSVNQRMDSQLTSLGISHDPLQIINGIGHDLGGLLSNVGNANFDFAASHFHS